MDHFACLIQRVQHQDTDKDSAKDDPALDSEMLIASELPHMAGQESESCRQVGNSRPFLFSCTAHTLRNSRELLILFMKSEGFAHARL